jgi:protein-S-isoprenylcysteine O-methyltransferase Ste14
MGATIGTTVFFYVTLLFEILLGGGLILSLLRPQDRVWPPPSKGSWQYWYIHLTTESSIACFLVVGWLDRNSLGLIHPMRFVFALIFIGSGSIVFLWALHTLSFNTSLGVKGKLITKGPYRYSRNPQYVAMVVFFSGMLLLFNSVFALITGSIGILWFLLLPFVEEPWLRTQFVDEYREYCEKVSRFI